MEENNQNKNNEEFIRRIEKAAEKGARSGGIKNNLFSSIPTIVIILIISLLIIPKINSINNGFKSIFEVDEPVENHDLTIENTGLLGHTVADFQDAILGDTSKLKKLEVFKQEVSDIVTITDTGLLNLKITTKTQMITYNGDVVYTVDLSNLKTADIALDEENKLVTIFIPHAKQEQINIPEDRMEFADPEKGLLAFGDIKITMEDTSRVQAEARIKMQEKLDKDKVIDMADRFAKLSVWEMYSPVIKGVAKNYSLIVEFK